MPFLRFTRDKRGYENTFVVDTTRRRGKPRTQVLYWFRTPPNVKVGRAPLDEEAIHAIEDGHPDITFDWPSILALPAPAPAPGRERPSQRPGVSVRPSEVVSPVIAPAPELPPTALVETLLEGDDLGADVPEPLFSRPVPAQELVGPEGLARLRARYAEIQARITERGGDPSLRERAEKLNPDAWVTLEEARQALDQAERLFDELRRVVGWPRRGARRGDRRHPLPDAANPASGPIPDEPEIPAGRPPETS